MPAEQRRQRQRTVYHHRGPEYIRIKYHGQWMKWHLARSMEDARGYFLHAESWEVAHIVVFGAGERVCGNCVGRGVPCTPVNDRGVVEEVKRAIGDVGRGGRGSRAR